MRASMMQGERKRAQSKKGSEDRTDCESAERVEREMRAEILESIPRDSVKQLESIETKVRVVQDGISEIFTYW